LLYILDDANRPSLCRLPDLLLLLLLRDPLNASTATIAALACGPMSISMSATHQAVGNYLPNAAPGAASRTRMARHTMRSAHPKLAVNQLLHQRQRQKSMSSREAIQGDVLSSPSTVMFFAKLSRVVFRQIPPKSRLLNLYLHLSIC
jgi:hypothetical protein